MTQQSSQLRKQGKINTQVALNIIADIRGYDVFKPDKRTNLIKRLRKEIPNEKYGEGKGGYYYFKKEDVVKFANMLKEVE